MQLDDGKLIGFLAKHRETIVGRWRDAIIETYPPDAAGFLHRDRDRFGNPIGYTIARETISLLDSLLADRPLERQREAVDSLMRIRAVQDFSPAQAVGFIFMLKAIIEKLLEDYSSEQDFALELLEFHHRIDALALLTFDAYSACRERIYQIRTGELKKWTNVSIRDLKQKRKNDE
jgi:hypothetical protein